MRKRWLIIGGVVAALSVSSVAFASGNVGGRISFDQMLPYAKQMHPNWSDQQIQEMYNDCVQNGGSGESDNDAQGYGNMRGMMRGYSGSMMGGWSS